MGEVKSQTLLKKGAEASLYAANWHGKKVVIKTRFPKKYRPEKLDRQIRTFRTVHEPQLMAEAKRAGVPTPVIFQVDVKNAIIIMELIEGKQIKKLLGTLSKTEREELCQKIGNLIGRLHCQDLIHGDLTTSNMILNREDKIFLVDFGLGEKNPEVEAKGVDLHLMKRALQSSHSEFAEECFRAVMRSYSAVVSEVEKKRILKKIIEIERRGRYVAKRKEEKTQQVSA
jgi:TP53 regulating kinase-like protein